MRDLLYLLLTVACFAVMLLYVRGCAALGRSSDGHASRGESERGLPS
ncbi:MAG TPA: hypothetical protein VGE27_10170 [Gemmatimonas sp.]